MKTEKLRQIHFLIQSEEMWVLKNHFLYESEIRIHRRIAAFLDKLEKNPDQDMAARSVLDSAFLADFIKIYKETPQNLQGYVIYAFGEIQSYRTFRKLLDILTNQKEDPTNRANAAIAISQHHNLKAVPTLLETLKDPQSKVRASSAQALGELRDERAVEPLIKALDDSDARVRWWVAEALGKLEHPSAVQPLLEHLHDSDPTVRMYVIRASQTLHSPEAVRPLLAILTDKNETTDLQIRVGWTLQKYADPSIAAPAIENLKSQDDGIRYNAITWLKEHGDKSALTPLNELLKSKLPPKSKGEKVRNFIREAIAEIEKRTQI